MSVRKMRLADVAKIYSGSNLEKEAFGGEGCPWVMVEDLDDTALEKTARRLTWEGMERARLSPKGTVFLSSTGTVGKTGIARETVACSNNVFALEFDTSLVCPLYGMYCLAALRPLFEKAGQTGAYSSLRLGDFREMTIPVPDMDWQRRVAGKLKKLRQLLDGQKAASEGMRRAAQEAFSARFQQSIELAIRGEGVPLREAAEIRLNGAAKARSESGVKVGYVATSQLENWAIDWDAVPQVTVEPFAAQRYQLRAGDIVMNRVNQNERVGRCGLADQIPSAPYVFAQNTLCIRAKKGVVRPGYLLAWLTHPFVRQYLQDHAKRSTSFQCTLSRETLEDLIVPRADLEEQIRFGRELRSYLEYVRTGARTVETLERLRQVLYDKICLLERSGEGERGTSQLWEGWYWTTPSGVDCFYDADRACIQVPVSAGRGLRLSQLPRGVDVQLLDELRRADHPRYGALDQVRLRLEEDGRWLLVRLEPAAYRPDGEDQGGETADQLEQQGMLSERQDFGYLRKTEGLAAEADMSVWELLRGREGERRRGYSRFDRLPAGAQRFVKGLSPFQQAVYEEFLLAMQPLTCHMVERQLLQRADGALPFRRGLQDVIAAVALLENVGLLEYRQGRYLEYQTQSEDQGTGDRMLDHRGRPISIGTWLCAEPRG